MKHRQVRTRRTLTGGLLACAFLPGLAACTAGIESTSGAKSPRPVLSPGSDFDSACRDGEDVDVTVDRADVDLEGLCGTVTITASHAWVDLHEANEVLVVGNHNTIYADKAGQLTVQGMYNEVTLNAVVGTLVDEGAHNTIDAS